MYSELHRLGHASHPSERQPVSLDVFAHVFGRRSTGISHVVRLREDDDKLDEGLGSTRPAGDIGRTPLLDSSCPNRHHLEASATLRAQPELIEIALEERHIASSGVVFLRWSGGAHLAGPPDFGHDFGRTTTEGCGRKKACSRLPLLEGIVSPRRSPIQNTRALRSE